MAPYQSSAARLVSRVLTTSQAQAVVSELTAHASKYAKALVASSTSRAKRQRRSEKAATKAFFATTYRPRYAQAQWLKYVALRAKQLGIRGAKVETVKLDASGSTDFSDAYDIPAFEFYGQAAESSNPELGVYGCLSTNNTRGIEWTRYVKVTAANGKQYLALIPLGLWNRKTLKQSKATADDPMATFFYLPDMSSLLESAHGDWTNLFVGKNERPSAAVVAENITLAGKLE